MLSLLLHRFPRATLLPLCLVLSLATDISAAPDQRVMVAMADGVRLETFVYLPGTQPAPVVLLRTPYRFPGQSEPYYDSFANALTERGYVFVLQNIRGRFGSEGVFDPFENAVADGAATVGWITGQPWSNGRIGTIGGSYNGYTALAAAVGSDAVRTVVADDPALDLWAGRRGGAVGLLPVFWLHLLDHGRWPDDAARAWASNETNPLQIDNLLLGRDDPFWQAYLEGHADSTEKSLRGQLDRICAPVLVLKSKSEGWEDPVDLWQALRQDGCPRHREAHQLIVTAEDHTFHLDQLGSGPTDVTQHVLDWLDHWLRDADAPAGAPVLYRPDAAEPFRNAGDWPVRGTETSFYLGQQFSLTGNGHLLQAPAQKAGKHSLAIDPAILSPCEDYPRQTYLSAPLDQDLLLAGPARLELFVRGTTGRAGLSAQLYDYDPDRPTALQFVSFAVAQVDALAVEAPQVVTLNMHSLSHRFEAGTRIALSLSGSACGYGEADHPAGVYEILHGADTPSRLVIEAVAE